MKQTALLLTALAAAAVSTLVSAATAQDVAKPRAAEAAKPSERTSKADPSPAPAAAPAATREGAQGQVVDPSKHPPRTLKAFVGEFRALDLDKKTLTFETEDGKRYTVPAGIPSRQDTMDRAAKLAEVLKPGDKIRMLCKVNEKEEPILILSLHMTSETAPMRYR